jgi:hypothetical protein
MELEPVEYSCDNAATKTLTIPKNNWYVTILYFFREIVENPYIVTEFLIKNQQKHRIRPSF